VLGAAVLAVLAFLAITQRWTAPRVWGNDAVSYSMMSSAAPGLPGADTVGSAYAGRFFPHYLVGLMHELGLGLHTAYWVVGIAGVIALALVFAAILRTLDVPLAVALLVLLAFVAAPYSTPRETLLAPGLLQDLVFVLGLGVCVLGLVRLSFPVVLGGVLLALAGRQTALLVVPVVAAWLLLDEPWRAASPLPRRRVQVAVVVVAGVALYGVILAITSAFSYHFAPDGFDDTLLGSPPSAKDFVSHVGRTLVPAVVPGAVLLATAFLLWRDGLGPERLPRRIWLLLALWGVVLVQPLIISPDFPGFEFNEQRLAGIGLLPLYVAVAILLREAVEVGAVRMPRAWVCGAAVAVAVASLSHVYSSVGPRSLPQFLVLQVLAAAVLAGLLVTGAGVRRGLPSAA
jgi:hypothetical protein